MGLTTWSGERPRKADISVAKNYLDEEELGLLNRIVTTYLEFAELQASSRKPMYMADWITRLEDFLRISDREILQHAGKIFHEAAVAKAELEYDRHAADRRSLPSPVERHFEDAVKQAKQIEEKRPAKNGKDRPGGKKEG